MDDRTLRFVEVQHFRQWWVWLPLVGATAAVVGLPGYGVVMQLVLGRPWGNNPMSDAALLAAAIATFVVWAALLALVAAMHLRTEVRADGLYVRFFPPHLSLRRLPLTDVSKVEVVTYLPLRQHGVWGLRFAKTGKAYTVSGDRGVKLSYTTGRHLLIGSQKADELAAAIQALRESGAGR